MKQTKRYQIIQMMSDPSFKTEDIARAANCSKKYVYSVRWSVRRAKQDAEAYREFVAAAPAAAPSAARRIFALLVAAVFVAAVAAIFMFNK